MKFIRIIGIVKEDGEEYNCGCEYEAICDEKGEIILSGDAYHDKISQMIDGFIEGIEYLTKDFEVEEKRETCPYCSLG